MEVRNFSLEKMEILYLNAAGQIEEYTSMAAKRAATLSALFEIRFIDFIYKSESEGFAKKYWNETELVERPSWRTKPVEAYIEPHWKSFGHPHCADTWHEGGTIITHVNIYETVEMPTRRAILARKVLDYLKMDL